MFSFAWHAARIAGYEDDAGEFGKKDTGGGNLNLRNPVSSRYQNNMCLFIFSYTLGTLVHEPNLSSPSPLFLPVADAAVTWSLNSLFLFVSRNWLRE